MIKTGIESFYDLLAKIPSGIIISDVNGKIIFMSKYFYENLTFRTEEEVNQGLYVWHLTSEDLIEELKLVVNHVRVNLPETTPRSRIYIGPNKNPLRVIVNWRYLKNASGEHTGYISTVVEDVSLRTENDPLKA